MTPRFTMVSALAVLAALGLASPTFAASAQDQAAADVLFKDAKKLAAAGDFEHACPKFVESQRLDPSSGTLLNIGNCYEKLGKLASAYGAFREAEVSARNSGDTGRQAEAARRAEALSPQLAKLSIVVPPAARVPGFELKKDGAVVGEGQWGSSLPADVGHHEIVASAPGHKPWSTVVRIDTNGAAASVEVPPLEKLPAEAGMGAGFTWSTQRSVGVAIGGVGVIGVVVGGVFGVITLNKASASKSHCTADLSTCDPIGGQLQHDAHTTANVSNAAFGIGGAALVAGVVAFVTTPNNGTKSGTNGGRFSVRPVVGIRHTGLAVWGEW